MPLPPLEPVPLWTLLDPGRLPTLPGLPQDKGLRGGQDPLPPLSLLTQAIGREWHLAPSSRRRVSQGCLAGALACR